MCDQRIKKKSQKIPLASQEVQMQGVSKVEGLQDVLANEGRRSEISLHAPPMKMTLLKTMPKLMKATSFVELFGVVDLHFHVAY